MTVEVDDGSGMACAVNTASVTATVNNPPRAVAKVNDVGCTGGAMVFDATSSSDPDGQRLTYRWDFGDGSMAEGSNVEHAYATGGNYPVTLRVDDGSGSPCGVAMAQGRVRINTPPIASAGPNLVCCTKEANTFDASKSSDPDGDALTYRWDFGDGSTAEGATVQHAFAKFGNFQVRVTVSDHHDAACGTSTTGFVANVNAPPVAKMAIRGEGGREIPATAGEPNPP